MFRNVIEKTPPLNGQLKTRLQLVQDELLRSSSYLARSNFTQIVDSDLECLFNLYDEHFFGGHCRKLLQEKKSPLTFRLSGKMTRAGGKTTRNQSLGKSGKVTSQRFEIAVSTTLLFGTFREQDEPIRVAGLICHNRLEALMRVMEHELIHLGEMLLYYESSCTAYRFREIASRLFAHRESNHNLITPQERALKDLGIRTGDFVSFLHDGLRLRGKVNRITRRATVLVPSDRGHLYSDGIRYDKFYVPLVRLSRC